MERCRHVTRTVTRLDCVARVSDEFHRDSRSADASADVPSGSVAVRSIKRQREDTSRQQYPLMQTRYAVSEVSCVRRTTCWPPPGYCL